VHDDDAGQRLADQHRDREGGLRRVRERRRDTGAARSPAVQEHGAPLASAAPRQAFAQRHAPIARDVDFLAGGRAGHEVAGRLVDVHDITHSPVDALDRALHEEVVELLDAAGGLRGVGDTADSVVQAIPAAPTVARPLLQLRGDRLNRRGDPPDLILGRFPEAIGDVPGGLPARDPEDREHRAAQLAPDEEEARERGRQHAKNDGAPEADHPAASLIQEKDREQDGDERHEREARG
jgi:hypothetical protein